MRTCARLIAAAAAVWLGVAVAPAHALTVSSSRCLTRASDFQPAPKTGRRYVVAAIGDSITDQRIGGGRYMAELQARCPDSRFDAYGVGGQQTSHMRWRFRQDVFGVGTTAAKPSYTHVIVFGGINDLAARHITPRALAEIEGNLAKMYGMAAARGLEVIAVALPPWGQSKFGKRPKAKATAVLNEWLSARAQTGQVDALVDVGADLACGSAMNLCPKYRKFPSDHVHWNAAGHRVLARHLFSQVFSDCR